MTSCVARSSFSTTSARCAASRSFRATSSVLAAAAAGASAARARGVPRGDRSAPLDCATSIDKSLCASVRLASSACSESYTRRSSLNRSLWRASSASRATSTSPEFESHGRAAAIVSVVRERIAMSSGMPPSSNLPPRAPHGLYRRSRRARTCSRRSSREGLSSVSLSSSSMLRTALDRAAGSIGGIAAPRGVPGGIGRRSRGDAVPRGVARGRAASWPRRPGCRSPRDVSRGVRFIASVGLAPPGLGGRSSATSTECYARRACTSLPSKGGAAGRRANTTTATCWRRPEGRVLRPGCSACAAWRRRRAAARVGRDACGGQAPAAVEPQAASHPAP